MEHYWTAGGRDIAGEISDLGEIIDDYPYGDPFLSISVLAGDAEDAAKAAAQYSPVLPVMGLVAVVPYLCWRSRNAALNDRVLASLEAVADALAPLPCPHGDAAHPAESRSLQPGDLHTTMYELARIDEDEPVDEEEAELWACPKNLAELARDGAATVREMLAEDGPVAQAKEGVYAPELQDLPDVFFDDVVVGHHTALVTGNRPDRAIGPRWVLDALLKIVRRETPRDDRPESDHRGWLLWCARELSARPDGPAGAGLVLALSSVADYAVGDAVPERAVRDELIEALSEAHRVRRDAVCDHGAHPELRPEERLVVAARLWDPEYGDENTRAWPVSAAVAEAASCPVHLREHALRHAADLRRDVAARFAPPAGGDPFHGPDGTPRIDRIARGVRFHLTTGTAETTAAVRCARRLLDGVDDPRERAVCVLAAAFAVRYPHWYSDVPGALDALTAALRAVAAADTPGCDHADGHAAKPLDTYTPPQVAQLIPLVYDSFGGTLHYRHPEARAFDRPNRYSREEGPGPVRWRCPGHLADVARLALAETEAGADAG